MRVLLVAQGSGGGIGRAEVLLAQALDRLQLERSVDWACAAKDSHPAYLSDGKRPRASRSSRIAFASQVALRFHRLRPDVVVFTHVNFAPLVAVLRPLSPSTKFVTVTHGREVWVRLGLLRRRALASCDRLWSVSNFTTARLVDTNGLNPARVDVLRWGLTENQLDDLVRSVRPKSSSAPSRTLTTLTVSRLDDGSRLKGVDDLLAAFVAINARLPESRLLVIGDGNRRGELESLARDLHIDSAVSFLGWVDDRTLARTYQESDVFALPSAQEGFGLVFLEAMAAGLPVVAANAGAAPELIRDGETGRLVEFGNRDAIADAICALLADPIQAQAFGQEGTRTVLSNYTMTHVTANIANLLQTTVQAGVGVLR